MLLDELIRQGYKQDKAEAVVGFLTRDAKKDVDYSAVLGKFGGNTVIDKISGMPLKELYSGYLTYDKYDDNIEKFITDSQVLLKDLEDDGQYTYEGKKTLVEAYENFLDTTVKLLGEQPLATNAYKTYFEYGGMEAAELMNFFIEYTNTVDIHFLISGRPNDFTFPDNFQNILFGEKTWANGPSLEQMEKLYNGEYGYLSEEELKLFEPYVSWRYMYEVEQGLNASGVTIEEYYEMMEALNKEPSWWEKHCEFWENVGWNTYDGVQAVKNFFDSWFNKNEEIAENEIDPISDKVKGKYLSEVKTQTLTASNTVYDPIILDLDGDGFNVETKENGTNFDLDKNGFAEKINWTTKDGFLCLDLNGNGTIDNGGELFGDKTLLADGTTAKNGFEALAQYDGNGDGVIDENEIILKFIINKQLSVGKFSLYSFALLKSAWLNDRLCYN